jgi:hypothetical protein
VGSPNVSSFFSVPILRTLFTESQHFFTKHDGGAGRSSQVGSAMAK